MPRGFKIDPEFKAALRPLTPQEREQLKLRIETEEPRKECLVVANIRGERILIDGHNTLEICGELRIDYPAPKEIKFPNRELALAWIRQNQQARRNLSPEELSELREKRIGRVVEARKEGQSIRTIADAEGKSVSTIHSDLEEAGVRGRTPEPPDGKVTGRDGKKQAATKARPESIFCERCQRVGPVKDCQACEITRREKITPSPREPRQPRIPNGDEVFRLRDYESHHGALVRDIDALCLPYGKVKSPEAEGLRRLLREFDTSFVALFKKLTKSH